MKTYKFLIPFVFSICATYSFCAGTTVKADTVVNVNKNKKIYSANLKVDKNIKVPLKKVYVKTNTYSRSGYYITYKNKRELIVSYAYKFLGRPYVWGGSGPSVFDCSGFTAYVYKILGITLPHYTVSQASLGVHVSRDNLKPGDLVFFNTSSRLSHVGIYVGNGKFIQASSGSNKVIVSSLYQSYYNSRYAGARRIIND